MTVMSMGRRCASEVMHTITRCCRAILVYANQMLFLRRVGSIFISTGSLR